MLSDVASNLLRLDSFSCLLTVISTLLVGKKLWQGWVVAALNSVIISIIGLRTAQFAFIPANLFCIVLYAHNLCRWRRTRMPRAPTISRNCGRNTRPDPRRRGDRRDRTRTSRMSRHASLYRAYKRKFYRKT